MDYFQVTAAKTHRKVAIQTDFSNSSHIIYFAFFSYFVVSLGPYQSIGCYKDFNDRAIPTLEGQDSILDGKYNARSNSIEKCYKAAKKRGFQVFAVQNGGWCASSALAIGTFTRYGKSSACKSDGEGGPWANQVYYIKGSYINILLIVLHVLVWSDRKTVVGSSDRSFDNLNGSHHQ